MLKIMAWLLIMILMLYGTHLIEYMPRKRDRLFFSAVFAIGGVTFTIFLLLSFG